MFDPISWGLGFVLNRLSVRLLEGNSDEILHRELIEDTKDWARGLPASIAGVAIDLFSETDTDATLETRPARFELQRVLFANGHVPDVKVWLDAFTEHWLAKRAELGERANDFFRIDESEAKAHLSNLAVCVFKRCASNAELSRRTLISQIDKVSSKLDTVRTEQQRFLSLPRFARDLPFEAQEMYLNRLDAWEYRLFVSVLEDCIHRHSSVRGDIQRKLFIGHREYIPDPQDGLNWLREKYAEGMQFGPTLSSLLNNEVQIAFGPDGTPGDPEKIAVVAMKIGEIYGAACNWISELNRALVHEQLAPIVTASSQLIEPTVIEMENFTGRVRAALSSSLEANTGQRQVVTLSMKLAVEPGAVEAIDNAMKEAVRYFESGQR